MSRTLLELASEALNALRTYNRYDIGSDTYAHSTELIRDLERVTIKHNIYVPMREPDIRKKDA